MGGRSARRLRGRGAERVALEGVAVQRPHRSRLSRSRPGMAAAPPARARPPFGASARARDRCAHRQRLRRCRRAALRSTRARGVAGSRQSVRSAADHRGVARAGSTPRAAYHRLVKTRLLKADAPGAVEEAAAALARGELVAFPTDTVYGLSAGQEHVRKLYGAKDRPQEKRIPVLLSDIGNLEASAIVTPIARPPAHRFWPGTPTTVLVAPRRGTMAFRVPDHPLARRLIAASGGGLPVTSANRSGEPDARTAQEVIAQLEWRITLGLARGTSPGGVSSTVVDCTGDQVKILRQGAITEAEIDEVLATVA